MSYKTSSVYLFNTSMCVSIKRPPYLLSNSGKKIKKGKKQPHFKNNIINIYKTAVAMKQTLGRQVAFTSGETYTAAAMRAGAGLCTLGYTNVVAVALAISKLKVAQLFWFTV